MRLLLDTQVRHHLQRVGAVIEPIPLHNQHRGQGFKARRPPQANRQKARPSPSGGRGFVHSGARIPRTPAQISGLLNFRDAGVIDPQLLGSNKNRRLSRNPKWSFAWRREDGC
jgi:uncharacterized protein YgbK (DUF1537 family)